MVNRFLSLVERIIWWITSITLLAVGLMAAAEVFMRYVFDSAHNWMDEFVVFVIMAIAFLALGNIALKDKHISIDILYARLSGKLRRNIDTFNYIVTAIVCGIIAMFSFEYTLSLARLGASSESSLPIPHWLISAILVLGLVLCSIFSLLKAYLNIRERTT